MEALAATSAAPTAPPVQAARAQSAPAPAAVPVQTRPATAALPALPAAVQRHQLETPEPALMTREQMTALLSLATG